MGGEERPRPHAMDEVLHHRAGDGDAVVRARAAPDFIEDDQRARRRVAEDRGGLHHLDEEGARACREVVLRADAGEDAIDEADRAPTSAGTNEPICAIRTISATCRR